MARRGSWKPGSQRAPKVSTIVISALLVALAAVLMLAGPTIADALRLPGGVAGSLEWIGVGAAAVAMALMLLGVFLEGL